MGETFGAGLKNRPTRKGDAMSQPRVSDDKIEAAIECAPEYGLVYLMALDLRDARAELARMKTLSDSQATALDEMESGRL